MTAQFWLAVAAGSLAWMINQGAGYAGIKAVCASSATPLLWMLAAATFLLACVGGWISWTALLRLRRPVPAAGAVADDRVRFMAIVALGFNALIAVLILTSAIPQFVLHPCE